MFRKIVHIVLCNIHFNGGYMPEVNLNRPALTAIILTLDNEDTIEACIRSVSWADEVIVYDSGSSDETIIISESLDARVVVDSEWLGFGAQRRKAQAFANGEWLMWVDSDEVMTESLREGVLQCLSATVDKKYAYSFNRVTDFFGRFIRHSGWYPDMVVRLYAKESYQYSDDIVHEKVNCPNNMIKAVDGDLLHYTSNSFSVYMSKSLRYANDWAHGKYKKGKEVTLFGIIVRTKFAFLRKYLLQKGFLDGRHGFLLAMQSSHYTFNKYFALWVLNQQSSKK